MTGKKLKVGWFSFSCCEDSVTGDGKLYAKLDGKLFFGTLDELEQKIAISKSYENTGRQIIKPENKLEVLSVAGNSKKNSKVVWKEAKFFIKHFVEKPILNVILRTGKSVKVTGDHSLFKRVITNKYVRNYLSQPVEKIVPCKVVNLSKGDAVWCVDDYAFDVPDKKIDDDLLELAGLWLAVGCYDHQHGLYISTGNDPEIITFLRKTGKKFGFNLTVRKNGDTTLNSRSFMRKFKGELGLYGDSATKKIPDWCFLLSNRQIKLLLRGYFSGDGTAENQAVSCTSASHELIADVKVLFNRVGIVTSITTYAKRTLVFGNKEYPGKELFRLAITKRDSLNRFGDIGFIQKSKTKKLKEYKNFRNKFYGLIAHSIRQLRAAETKCCVYDFDVPGTQNFVVNGVLCHNSTIVFTELLNDHYEEWMRLLDFRSARVLQKKGEVRDIDVAFVEGAIANKRDAEELKRIRANSRRLVAIGSCAVTGNPAAQRNTFSEELKSHIEPAIELYDLNRKVQRLDEVVKVDDIVGGCPMVEQTFLSVLGKYLKEFGVTDAQL